MRRQRLLYECFQRGFSVYKGHSPERLVSVKDLRVKLAEHVAVLQERSKQGHVSSVDPASLAPRLMKDSWDQVLLPLSSDEKLRLQYLNLLGNIRFGRILEDLDTFAVWLSYRHNQGLENEGQPPRHHPMCLVTACVDRIDIREGAPIPVDKDIVMEGHVSWVGRSSLETTMRLLSGGRDLLQAKFVMVALDPATFKPVRVHPMETTSPEEESIFTEGDTHALLRKTQARESLLKLPPTSGESQLLHDIFRKTIDEKHHSFKSRLLPDGAVWMDDCKLKTVHICHPEQRNLYHKIFGGFLMRLAFELAWANARVYARDRPMIVAVDDIVFVNSVEVGSMLYLSSQVSYSKDNMMQVQVHAEVVDPDTDTFLTTNTFQFTFSAPHKLPEVLPRTYSDGMLYLTGKRHFDEAMRLRSN